MNTPLVKPKSKLSACSYTYDGGPADADAKHYCICGAREDHPRHEMPPVSDEERAARARILGEARQ